MYTRYEVRQNGKTVRIIERSGKDSAEELAGYLIRKYIYKAEWVRRIHRAPDYEVGGDIITVYIDNGDRVTIWTARDKGVEE